MRYKASISYDGSKFYGFQRLKNKLNIQETLEKALTKINKSLVVVKGAGRTDRGVHAYNQMIHFDLNVNIPEDRLKNAINSLVEPHIHVNYCEKVDNNFHARFSVITKTYQYVINMGEFDALDDDYLYNYCHKLNIKKMKKASKLLLGFHSYKAFTSGERENYNSIIYKIKLTGPRVYSFFFEISKIIPVPHKLIINKIIAMISGMAKIFDFFLIRLKFL